MPTYQPGIPTGTVALSQDYLNLQHNFTALNDSFAINHMPFADTSAQLGYHTVISFVSFSTLASNPPNNQPAVVPANIDGSGQLFTAQIQDGINEDEALYFLTGGNRLTQFTRNFAPAVDTMIGIQNETKGATFLPGGLILNYGSFAGFGASTTINFKQPFISSIYSVTLGGALVSNVTYGIPTLTTMVLSYTGSVGRISYMVIGV